MTDTRERAMDPAQTPQNYVFHTTTTVDPPWTALAPIAPGEGGLNGHLLVEKDGAPCVRFELRKSTIAECWAHQEALYWNGVFAIGFAERVHLVTPAGAMINRIALDEYFCGFQAEEDGLLVATGGRVLRLDECGEVVWRSERLALDGVVIRTVQGGVVFGEGEWDPPGGWRSFALTLSDGTALE
jgi:hypothetical protein